jgi:membrane-bound metal-dependent hydrolase YbcI (DUF457 family)
LYLLPYQSFTAIADFRHSTPDAAQSPYMPWRLDCEKIHLMPSPVGHALGGLAAGWLVSPTDGSGWLRRAAWFGVLGVAADLDLFVGAHSRYSHSIGAVAVIGLAVFLGRGFYRLDETSDPAPAASSLLALASAAAYGSHILLDWLGSDTSPPIGIMALWPFSDAFYESSRHWFMAISRRYWLPGFWTHNLKAIAWEVALLSPLVGLVWWIRRRAPAGAGYEE